MNEIEFMEELEREMNRVEEITKEESNRVMAQIHEQRNRNIAKREESTKEELKKEIESIYINTDYYAKIINIFLKANLYRPENDIIKQIEVDKGFHLFTPNNYRDLGINAKNELFQHLENCLKVIPIGWFQALTEKIELNGLPIFKDLSLSEEEKVLFLEQIRKLALFYYKGYIIKDDVKAYTLESLPCLLYLFEKVDQKYFYHIELFEYQEGLIKEEELQNAKEIITNWFKQNWTTKINLNQRIDEHIQKDEYKNGRRLLLKYGYLVSEDEFKERKQILLSMLYKQYQEILNMPNVLEKVNKLNDIRNELNHYKN